MGGRSDQRSKNSDDEEFSSNYSNDLQHWLYRSKCGRLYGIVANLRQHSHGGFKLHHQCYVYAIC